MDFKNKKIYTFFSMQKCCIKNVAIKMFAGSCDYELEKEIEPDQFTRFNFIGYKQTDESKISADEVLVNFII